jgi:hypothetical protein
VVNQSIWVEEETADRAWDDIINVSTVLQYYWLRISMPEGRVLWLSYCKPSSVADNGRFACIVMALFAKPVRVSKRPHAPTRCVVLLFLRLRQPCSVHPH